MHSGEEKCNNYGKSGQKDDGCWMKHPEKAPQWYQDPKKKKVASRSSIDIVG